MVIEFSVENYKSFRDLQTLRMQAAKIKSKHSNLDKNNIIPIKENLSVLKSKAIFGANASGKSNLIKAMITMWRIIRFSIKRDQLLDTFSRDFFKLNVSNKEEPIFFQIMFYNEIEYRYGFTIFQNKIKSEWLFGVPNKREVYFFTREGETVKINNKRFNEGNRILPKNENDTPFFRSNTLFLSVLAAFNGKISSNIYKYFSSKFFPVGNELFSSSFINLAKDSFLREDLNKKLNRIIGNIDFNIGHVTVSQQKENDILDTNGSDFSNTNRPLIIYRKKYDKNGKEVGLYPIRFEDEAAEGTKKLVAFSPILSFTLEVGGIILIDEFDALLHPNLTKKIVQLFNSEQTNPNNAQLIFATHDSNLLNSSLLRRDQICFVEKDKLGASSLTSLVEYKGVRNDASYEKDYLKGKYGAIPYLNRFDWAFDNAE